MGLDFGIFLGKTQRGTQYLVYKQFMQSRLL